jgi:hypothetical protein
VLSLLGVGSPPVGTAVKTIENVDGLIQALVAVRA